MKGKTSPFGCFVLKRSLTVLVLLLGLTLPDRAEAFNLTVVDPQGDPITGGFRWLVEEDTTTLTTPGERTHASINNVIHNSYAPVVAKGESLGASVTISNDLNGNALDPNKRYFVTVLPEIANYSSSGTVVPALSDFDYPRFNNNLRVTVNPQPIPTAQISILVFEDHNPINNAPDTPGEAGIGGAKVFISDLGGPLVQDAFGNPLGTTYQLCGDTGTMLSTEGTPCVLTMGDGNIYTMTAANQNDPVKNPYGLPVGEALIKFLAPGKYGVQVVPPQLDEAGNPVTWVQTATIEGTPVVDAWVRADEPELFIEGFGTGFNHVFFGYVNRTALPWVASPPAGATGTISGKLVYNHYSRPPFNQGFFPGAPVPDCWVGLNDPVTGTGLYAAACNDDSTFTIPNVPPGTYQLVTWDKALDALFGFSTVIVPQGAGGGAPVELGNVLSFRWFGSLEGKIFLDSDQDGFPDPAEPGIPEQAVNLRFRNGAIYQGQTTDMAGGYQFSEVFPFFKWLVVEADFARFKATGITSVVDYGGEVLPDAGWDWPSRDKLFPQAQAQTNVNTGNNLSRTETGPILTQAMHLFLNQHNEIHWGKTYYGPGENGGISGLVYYSVTRAENDPRYGAPEPWEVGIPRVQVNLYRDFNRDGLIDDLALPAGLQLADVDNYPQGDFPGPGDIDRNGNGLFDLGDAVEVTYTDSWDDNKPTGCIRETTPVIHGAEIDPCADSYGTWNQVRDGVFDGGYAFPANLPTGTYIVEAAAPPGYTLVKEEDKNVDFGDTFTPSLQLLPPVCVGDGHLVPAQLSLFPGVPSVFAGQTRPLCDRKQVTLFDGQNSAADFYYFTEVPKAARVVGFSNNDLSAEFDSTSPVFGEKSAPSWLPVAIKDWSGNELMRVYMDEFGSYNALLPSTLTMNVPAPSGVSPNMLTVVLNDPFMPDPVNPGQKIPDPYYDPNYSVTPWTFNYTPGHVSYLDTPLVPIAAFAGFPKGGVDGNPANGVPVIALVDGAAGGPLICTDQSADRTVFIASIGVAQVTNPDYDFNDPESTPLIARDYGFGSVPGAVTLDGTPLPIDSWDNGSIIVTVPAELGTGRLLVTRGDNGQTSPNGVTLTITACADTVRNVPEDYPTIQAAIDAANAGDLVLVAPGTYHEMVIMYKPVRLQGAGAASTFINANPGGTNLLVNWHSKIQQLLGADPFRANEGAGIMVLGNAGFNFTEAPSRIDGFTILGALAGGGIDVNSEVANLIISNNRITANQGNFAGGIAVGTPQVADSNNTGLVIRDNWILKNGGIQGAGGIAFYADTNGYLVENNLIMGNLSRFNGGGLAHIGVSNGGVIRNNRIVLNEVFNGLNIQGAGDGGGIFVGSELAGGAGTGSVTIEANLIQGNLAGAGHGGGIRAFFLTEGDTLTVVNNIIANNVAGLAAGGISLQNVPTANLLHNTVVNNDSTSTGANAFIAGALDSVGQPAGLVAASANPTLVNNIILHNRSFGYDHSLNNLQGGLASYGYWDLAGTMSVQNTLLTTLGAAGNGGVDYTGNGNLALGGSAVFLREYFNNLVTAAVIDEGGNAINVKFTTLDIRAGDYHLRFGAQPINQGSVTAVTTDIDGQPRTGAPDLGADEQLSLFPVAKIGVFRGGKWYLDADGNGAWNGGIDFAYASFGLATDQPVTGDWNGDAITAIGTFRNGSWYLDADGNGAWNIGDTTLGSFGQAGDQAVTGDWNGDGRTQIGVFRNGTWHLDEDGNGQLNLAFDSALAFGSATDIPVTGDWNGDGVTQIGVFRNGTWYLDANGNGAWDAGIDTVLAFGQTGDRPVTGDWNGDGITDIGVFRGGKWYLDFNGNGAWSPGVDLIYNSFGLPADRPLAGIWH
ncbi:MAG: hypothetical protein IH614_16760 [Desulfuromonadales bacterium]|nr:hypothetical protein [Desulfuromonadales bacterium]